MKIEKAIEILTGMFEWEEGYLKENERQGLKLGIKALERLRTLRSIDPVTLGAFLPDETKD